MRQPLDRARLLRFLNALALALTACLTVSAWGAPGWFNNNADQRGFLPGLPDFYQHQGYVGDLVDGGGKDSKWETTYPNRTAKASLARLGGWCREVAIVDLLARLEANGFKGVTEADINAGGNAWLAASTTAIKAQDAATSIQSYLDTRRGTADGKKWADDLKFNQFTVDAAGEVTVDGKVWKEGPAKTPVNAFEIYKRLLVNEQGPMVRIEKGTNTAVTVWWGNYHCVAGGGVSEKNGKMQMFVADPDTNKGSRAAKTTYKLGSSTDTDSGDGGWVFFERNRANPPGADNVSNVTFLDFTSGAAIDSTKKFTEVINCDNTPDPTRGVFRNGAAASDTGPYALGKKSDDANINARKYVAGDNDPPILKTAVDKTDPANISTRLATWEFDTSTLAKARVVTKSNDFSDDVTADGAYKGVAITALETISKSPVDKQLQPIPLSGRSSGFETTLILVCSLTNPVDAIQIVPVASVGVNAVDIDGQDFNDSAGETWHAHYINPGPGVSDAWGNDLPALGNPGEGGAWQFDLNPLTGPGLRPFPPVDLQGNPDYLELRVASAASLLQYHVFVHEATTTEDGQPFGGYWLMYAYGAAEQLIGDQTDGLADIVVSGHGACCRGVICTLAFSGNCTGANTQFKGVNVACNAPGNNTSPCCKANFNHVSFITVQDLFGYLSAWFAQSPSADFDGSGTVTIQDLFNYLAAWFAGGCI